MLRDTTCKVYVHVHVHIHMQATCTCTIIHVHVHVYVHVYVHYVSMCIVYSLLYVYLAPDGLLNPKKKVFEQIQVNMYMYICIYVRIFKVCRDIPLSI